ARDGVGHGIGEAPLPRRAPGVLHDVRELPVVALALAEHPLEHLAQLRAARVEAEEDVVVAPILGEAGDEGVHVLAVEGVGEAIDDAHGSLPRRRGTAFSRQRRISSRQMRKAISPSPAGSAMSPSSSTNSRRVTMRRPAASAKPSSMSFCWTVMVRMRSASAMRWRWRLRSVEVIESSPR